MHYLFSGVKITIHFLINGILLYIWATLNIKATHRNPRKRHDWRTYKDMGWVKEWTRDIQAEVTLRHEGRKVCPPVTPSQRESFVGQRHYQNCSKKAGRAQRQGAWSLSPPPSSLLKSSHWQTQSEAWRTQQHHGRAKQNRFEGTGKRAKGPQLSSQSPKRE